jgi:hypothetical protein
VAWDGLLAWAALAAWILALQSRVVVYGLPDCGGDWYEHYERTVFFLQGLPVDTRFLGFWTLAARGPLFNAAAAFSMNLLPTVDFWGYQVIAGTLNTFVVIPAALLLRDLAGIRQGKALLFSTVLFALAPAYTLEAISTITKMLTTALILGAIHLYVRGLTDKCRWLVGLSLLAWAAAILSHFMALLYAVFFGAHWVYTVVRERWDWRSVAWPLVTASLLGGFWFAFLFHHFGFKGTLTANTTLGQAYARQFFDDEPPPRALVSARNLLTTLVPCWVREALPGESPPLKCPPVLEGALRAGEPFSDLALSPAMNWKYFLVFRLYVLPGALGLGGCILLVAWIFRTLRGPPRGSKNGRPGRLFWLLFFLIGVPLNVAAKTEPSPYGVLLLNLQPFLWLTVVFLISRLWTLNRRVRHAVIAVFLIESAFVTGTLISMEQTLVPARLGDGGQLVGTEDATYSIDRLSNYHLKLVSRAVFLSDRPGELRRWTIASATVLSLLLLAASLWAAARSGDRRPHVPPG